MVEDGWLVRGSTAPDDVRRYYDELAVSYDTTLASWGYRAPARIAALTLAALEPLDGGSDLSILDAGCGTGLAGQALRDAGYAGSLFGVDLSPPSVALARERGIYDEVAVGDLQRPLPYGADRFDAVVCVGVLTYVPDVAGVGSEFCRVVRPGGVVALTQRDDVWRERDSANVLHEFERAGRWAVFHLSPPCSYLPGNADFGDTIGVRYLAARVRG
jgi:predicted TPR repeat methyltransferase